MSGCAAAEAVATARKALIGLMLVMRRRASVVMGVLLRAGLGVGSAPMKRRTRVAVRERKRQRHHQEADEWGPHHRNEHVTPKGLKVIHSPDSTSAASTRSPWSRRQRRPFFLLIAATSKLPFSYCTLRTRVVPYGVVAWRDDVPTGGMPCRKTRREVAPAIVWRNLEESLAVDPLQMQPGVIISSIADCRLRWHRRLGSVAC